MLNRRYRGLRIIVLTVVVLIGGVVLWWAVSRVTSAGRAIRMVGNSVVEPDARVPHVIIAAYNIAHGRGPVESNWDGGSAAERRERLGDIAALLRELDADIVVLNEVDFDCQWSGGVNQAATLAGDAGYPYRVEQRNIDAAIPFLSFRFGNAILSRYPVSEARRIAYPARSRFESIVAGRKLGVVCTVAHPLGAIRVVAVHLDHADRATRVASARVLAEVVAESDLPTFLVGDFNSGWGSLAAARADPARPSALSVLLDGDVAHTDRLEANRASDATFPSYAPRVVIDWILAPESWRFEAQRVPRSDLSDHLPVSARLRPPP